MSAVKHYKAMRISAINILRRRTELLYNATQALLLAGCLLARY